MAAAMRIFACDHAFGILVLFASALAFSFPSLFIEWGGVKLVSLIVPAIQIIMFGMGTTLTLADFVRILKRPWAVGVGVALQFAVMPLVGFVVARLFGFSGELAAGCILVGSVAGGTASNVIAFLAKADVALSVAMTSCSTLLSPILTPVAMKFLAGRFVEIDALAMMLEMLKIVIVPVFAGLAVRRLFRNLFLRRKEACDKILSTVSMAGICFTLLAITAQCRDAFASAGVLVVAAAIMHNTCGYLLGYWLVRLLGRFSNLDERAARTVAIEVGMQNGGMAAALAVRVLGSTTAALPANMFSIWMNFSGSLLANWWKKRPVGYRPRSLLPISGRV